VAVDERVPERPVLRHAHEGVIDRLVAVRVVLLQHVADHGGALAVWSVGPVAGLEHRPKDPLVDRLQAVTHVRQRAPDDDRHGVVEVRPLDLVLEVHGLDAPGEQPFLRHDLRSAPQTSRFWTYFALRSMKSLREATSSPISTEKRRSAATASSSVTCRSVRRSGSMVVSQSWMASISPRPLNRWGSPSFLPLAFLRNSS